MKREDRELLLIDICGRLSHETWVQYDGKDWLVTGYGHGRVSLLPSVFSSVGGPCPLVEEVRPYLRPMSSMTEEEYKEYDKETDIDVADSSETLKANLAAKSRVRISKWYHGTDWLDAHHFDYRGLIEKGLALEAPEDMYKEEWL